MIIEFESKLNLYMYSSDEINESTFYYTQKCVQTILRRRLHCHRRINAHSPDHQLLQDFPLTPM